MKENGVSQTTIIVYKRLPWSYKSESGGWQDAYAIDWKATARNLIRRLIEGV